MQLACSAASGGGAAAPPLNEVTYRPQVDQATGRRHARSFVPRLKLIISTGARERLLRSSSVFFKVRSWLGHCGFDEDTN